MGVDLFKICDGFVLNPELFDRDRSKLKVMLLHVDKVGWNLSAKCFTRNFGDPSSYTCSLGAHWLSDGFLNGNRISKLSLQNWDDPKPMIEFLRSNIFEKMFGMQTNTFVTLGNFPLFKVYPGTHINEINRSWDTAVALYLRGCS